ncbi:hypothetical protein CEW92_03685 [Bacillaceae bacterium SAS-127]|nr:hypothetical protein CEW92_03685 [Bacillaceae bacterium SAS-127]
MEEITSSLRVKVRKEYLSFFKDLRNKNIFEQHSSFFTLCACVGHRLGTIDDSYKGIELFQAYTFTTYQKAVLQSLIYDKTKQLTEEKEMFAEAEKYADAGFRFLIEQPLKSVAIKLESGEYSLQLGREEEFQKLLSRYVLGQMEEVPF